MEVDGPCFCGKSKTLTAVDTAEIERRRRVDGGGKGFFFRVIEEREREERERDFNWWGKQNK